MPTLRASRASWPSVGKKEDRCAAWRRAIESKDLFESEAAERDLNYSHLGWEFWFMEDAGVGATMTHAFQFNQAAARYLDHVLNTILPGLGLLSN